MDRNIFRYTEEMSWSERVNELIVTLFYLILAIFPVQSLDIFMYLAIARRYFRDGTFPLTDPFLFTLPNYPWNVLHEWASYFVYYGLFQLGGWSGVILGKAILVTGLPILLFFLARRLQVKATVAAWLLLIASAPLSLMMTERSLMFSDLFSGMVVAILILQKRKPGKLCYALPFIFMLWVNLHPGFLVGITFLVFWLLDELVEHGRSFDRKMGGVFFSSIAALFVNPSGWKGAWFPIHFSLNEAQFMRNQFNEWSSFVVNAPNDDLLFPVLICFGMISVLTVFLLSLSLITPCTPPLCPAGTHPSLKEGVSLASMSSKQKKPLFESLVFVFVFSLTLYATRFLALSTFCIAIIALSLAQELPVLTPAARASKMSLATLVVTLIAILKVVFWGYTNARGDHHLGFGLNTVHLPIHAAEFLEAHGLPSRMYNSHSIGAYLAWRWDGTPQVFVHGFVNDKHFYLSDFTGPMKDPDEFLRVVKKYSLTTLFLDASEKGMIMAQEVEQAFHWRVIYRDAKFVILER